MRALTLPIFIPTTCSFLLDLQSTEDENTLVDISFSADGISLARFIGNRVFSQCAGTYCSTLIRKITIYLDYFRYSRISLDINRRQIVQRCKI